MAKVKQTTTTTTTTTSSSSRSRMQDDTVEIEEGGVQVGSTQEVEQQKNYTPLKVSLWSRMGGFFRNGVRAGVGAAALTGVTYGAAAIVAASTLPYATAVAFTFLTVTV